MPIDLSDNLQEVSNAVFGHNFIKETFANPIFISLLLSVVILALIMFIYPAKPNTGFSVLVKLFIYISLYTFVVLFIHTGVLKKKWSDELRQIENDSVLDSALNGLPAYKKMNMNTTPNVSVSDLTANPETDAANAANAANSSTNAVSGGDTFNGSNTGPRVDLLQRRYEVPLEGISSIMGGDVVNFGTTSNVKTGVGIEGGLLQKIQSRTN